MRLAHRGALAARAWDDGGMTREPQHDAAEQPAPTGPVGRRGSRQIVWLIGAVAVLLLAGSLVALLLSAPDVASVLAVAALLVAVVGAVLARWRGRAMRDAAAERGER